MKLVFRAHSFIFFCVCVCVRAREYLPPMRLLASLNCYNNAKCDFNVRPVKRVRVCVCVSAKARSTAVMYLCPLRYSASKLYFHSHPFISCSLAVCCSFFFFFSDQPAVLCNGKHEIIYYRGAVTSVRAEQKPRLRGNVFYYSYPSFRALSLSRVVAACARERRHPHLLSFSRSPAPARVSSSPFVFLPHTFIFFFFGLSFLI